MISLNVNLQINTFETHLYNNGPYFCQAQDPHKL
jgi:hypothetical protein